MHPSRTLAELIRAAGRSCFQVSALSLFAHRLRFRVLNIVDDVTRECLAAVPDTSISGKRVVRELTDLMAQRGRPGMIVSDNGTELTSNAVLVWCGEAGIEWHYTMP